MDKPAVDEAGAVGQFLEPVFGILALEKDALKDPHAKRMDAEPGDHIACPIEGSEMWHHAIYVGKNEEGLSMVVEMAGKAPPDTAAIVKRPLDEFGPYLVIKYNEPDEEERLKASVKRANKLYKAAQRNPSQFPYDIIRQNYETIAVFCRTGRRCARCMRQRLRAHLAALRIVRKPQPKQGIVSRMPAA